MLEPLTKSPSNNDINQSQLVADKFSAAAKVYGEFDQLQKMSASLLLKGIGACAWQTQHILDLGAGPGTEFSKVKGQAKDQSIASSQVVAVDIAAGMLLELKSRFPHYAALCGDAQSLPLADHSIGLVYSNLALQWCKDLGKAISEIHRVMQIDAELHCAIVADGSLPQLAALGFKVNAFATQAQMITAMDECLWQSHSVEQIELTVYFDDLRSLLYSIKGVGASITANDPGNRATGEKLRGRQDWLALQRKAEVLREERGIPLSYQIAVIRAKKA